MTPERIAEIRERAEKAHRHIGDICAGKARWKMTIPADEERDSDLIFSSSLQDVFNLLAEGERDLAIAHDRQPYPTAWAYEQAVKTIERMRPLVKRAQQLREDMSASPYLGAPPSLVDLIAAVDEYDTALVALAMASRVGNSPAVDGHPERFCNRCGGPNVHAWTAPSPLWNQVMRGGDINATDLFDGIVCTVCFAQLAEEAGIAERWRFYAEQVHVDLATVTPSGRVWNPQTWLWEEPDAACQRCGGLDGTHTIRDCAENGSPAGGGCGPFHPRYPHGCQQPATEG